VLPGPDWPRLLRDDLERAGRGVAGVQGRVEVPLPANRRPTDWERSVAGLEHARWATADMAYRRDVLDELGGFDEGFPRPYREDADLALRVLRAGYRLERGRRTVVHPVGAERRWASVARQSGNADDARMDAKHGPSWRREIGAPRGRLRRHLAVAAAGVAAPIVATRSRRAGAVLAAAWLAGTAELAITRTAAGPRTPREVTAMVLTSIVLPFAAVAWALEGHRRARGWVEPAVGAVLFDRDGTLVEDVPYNGDPGRVVPRPGAEAALRACRSAGVPTAVVTNQSAIAAGSLSVAQVNAVNAEIERRLGPIRAWLVCPHGPDDGCGCRKPRPGMIEEAARRLGVPTGRCVVIGDTGSDVEAAHRAGALGILVPTDVTRDDEVAAAAIVAPDVERAVAIALGDTR
jgi:histidinol-phosphate phosphatase family protein